MLAFTAPALATAQFGAGYGPPLQVVPPPKEFATSEEHYRYLLEQAGGGTEHTIETVPRWDGLWQTAGNTMMDIFVDAPGFTGKVREGVLTPEYEAAYKERWREQVELGEVQEEGFKDARGTTLFPHLPGQSRDPIYNTTLPTSD